jgi:hypothetical protein
LSLTEQVGAATRSFVFSNLSSKKEIMLKPRSSTSAQRVDLRMPYKTIVQVLFFHLLFLGLVPIGNTYTLAGQNTFFGDQSGSSITTGTYNHFSGYNAGVYTTVGDANTFVGANAGLHNTEGGANVFLGNIAGYENTLGGSNTFLGNYAGSANTTGDFNTFIGSHAGRDNISGQENVFVGRATGLGITTGNRNIFLGHEAGSYSETATGNISIGFQAGVSERGNNKLYLENSSSESPLIFGDFEQDQVVINGNASLNTNNRTLFVNGSIGASSPFNNDSDRRLKTNINVVSDALDKVLRLRGVHFEWIDQREEGTRLGFIAQEVETILPEVIDHKNDQYTMQYAPVAALLVEAVKEQQTQIEVLKAENKALTAKIAQIDELARRLSQLHKQITASTTVNVSNN